jgi:predicted GH43/DUF377 family glycosyl hydrolase
MTRSWVRRTDLVLSPDPSRVVSRIFLPGQEMPTAGISRSTAVLERVLQLTDAEVGTALEEARGDFGGRHRDIAATWDANADLVDHRRVSAEDLSAQRRQLIGAYFTQEYSIEGAALFNPSMVAHPDQSGLAEGSTRFLMTLRAVGEGHISSIELRTGVVDAHDEVVLDPSPEYAVLATPTAATFSREAFEHELHDVGGEHANSDFVLDLLPPTFTRVQLEEALSDLLDQRLTRGSGVRAIDRLTWIADSNYAVEFPESSLLQERVLMPRGPAESHGMEDARAVRFVEDDGTAEYLATYTAYDGRDITSQLLRTPDFRTIESIQLSGPGSRNKGLALFPRRVGGRFLAVSRADRESNAITSSDDLRHWAEPELVQAPTEPWETVQLGNCGPPIETEAGWLVLTHGVGAMRVYSIGALLLDLDDPTVVLGRLTSPLLTPAPDERSGYVPNVVYSCGALLHGRTLVLPYGCSDTRSRVALVDLDRLLDDLRPG